MVLNHFPIFSFCESSERKKNKRTKENKIIDEEQIKKERKLKQTMKKLKGKRLDSNIESKSLNNTHLNRDLIVTSNQNH